MEERVKKLISQKEVGTTNSVEEQMQYDDYNREERSLCFHLFRLLHEKLVDQPQASALKRFIEILAKKFGEIRPNELKYTNIGIYAEVALIRDAYFARKANVNDFMDELTKLIMAQEGVSNCRLYSRLPSKLRDAQDTHPRQIRQKAKDFTLDETKVYGAMQGMFNAKPDLAITVDDLLISVEAKFTQKFDEVQFRRTQNITNIWAELLIVTWDFQASKDYCKNRCASFLSTNYLE
jgi:hypothetical protein